MSTVLDKKHTDNLLSLNLKSSYWSDEDDALLDFYIPALEISKSYKRVAGYFSSNALAVAAKGIAGLIQNGGKMQLVTSVVLSEDDKSSIENALSNATFNLTKDLESLEDKLKKNHIAMLGWMVKQGSLEIKIAVVEKGIFHPKIGILNDGQNALSFSGSENETAGGWVYNDETFHVFKSWEGDAAHYRHDERIFD